MTAPNMATITESLERSLQNFSLNHERRSSNSGGGGDGGGEDGLTRRSSTSDDNNNNNSRNLPIGVSDTSLELNSHLSLPYHWEQCLDLKTGEIYYINWRNGMKASQDPRTAAQYSGGDFYSDEEEDEDDDEDSSYDSEESPSESSPCSTRDKGHYNSSNSNSNNNNRRAEKDKDNVLVVAGCKSCLMYFMVPKQVEDCPKCNGQLLHFDRSESTSP
ncbi:hypothetical protein GQ457_17G005640 [Hibiscus cannabinus]